MAWIPNGVEKLPKILIAWVGCTNVTDDRQTDDRQTDGRRHIATFTFAKNLLNMVCWANDSTENYKRWKLAPHCHCRSPVSPLTHETAPIMQQVTKFQQNWTMHCWICMYCCIANDSTHFQPVFRELNVAPFSQKLGTELTRPNFGEHISVIGASQICFTFPV